MDSPLVGLIQKKKRTNLHLSSDRFVWLSLEIQNKHLMFEATGGI